MNTGRFAFADAVTRLVVLVFSVTAINGCTTMMSPSSPQPAANVDSEAVQESAAEPVTNTGNDAAADDVRQQAAEAYAAGDMETALYMFVEAVRLDPQDSHSLYAIGAIHENLGNYELAMQAYQRTVEIDATHALAQQQLGTAQLRMRDIDAATASLNAAIENDPTLWRAHDLLGVIADMQARYSDAIAHYSRAIALQPDVASTVNNRGYSKYLAGDLNAALQDFELALRIDADFDKAWKNVGLVHARQQRYREAVAVMEHVVASHIVANDVGYIAMLNGDLTDARLLFEEAIRLSPRYYPIAIENLANLERAPDSDSALSPTAQPLPAAASATQP